jgi:rRNA small subunit pseudouridine methyltransferase Nep1
MLFPPRPVPHGVLRFILAGAELELAPPEIAGHPAIRATARDQERKPGEVLLDQNMHGAATSRLADGRRRGRPDIVHYTLLVLLESPLCKAGRMEIAIHTRHGELIRIRPDTRLPRGEARFQGLVGKVLREGASNDKEPLLWSEGPKEPHEVIDAFARGPILRLDETGTVTSPSDIVARARDGELTLVLGAFPSGDFPDGWKKAAPEGVSIWKEPLNAWAVAAELSAAYRARWDSAPPSR